MYSASVLIAFIQKMWHSLVKVENHLAKHAIRPAEPVEIVSAYCSVISDSKGEMKIKTHHCRDQS